MSPRHSDAKPGWIIRRFRAIEKQIREQAAARRMESATIGKGGLTIKGGGKITVPFPPDLGTGNAVYVGPESDGVHRAYLLQVNGSDGVTPVMFARSIPPQTDYPAGASSAGFLGDIVSVEGRNSVYAWLPATAEGLVVGAGETDVMSAGVVYLEGGTGGTRIFHSTTGAAANCYIDPSNSRIWRSTSSRRYKRDIEDAVVDPAAVLAMQPRTWRDKGDVERDSKTQRRHVGFIAEELHDLGLTAFVDYEPVWTCRDCEAKGEGWPTRGSRSEPAPENPADVHEAETGHSVRRTTRPDAIAYDRLSVALLAVLKDQERRLQMLEGSAED